MDWFLSIVDFQDARYAHVMRCPCAFKWISRYSEVGWCCDRKRIRWRYTIASEKVVFSDPRCFQVTVFRLVPTRLSRLPWLHIWSTVTEEAVLGEVRLFGFLDFGDFHESIIVHGSRGHWITTCQRVRFQMLAFSRTSPKKIYHIVALPIRQDVPLLRSDCRPLLRVLPFLNSSIGRRWKVRTCQENTRAVSWSVSDFLNLRIWSIA